MSQKTITIQFPGEGAGETILVQEESRDVVKLLEHPISKAAKYGDTVRIKNLDANNYEFLEVVTPSALELWQVVITAEVAATDEMQALLTKLTEAGGYWQQDFGGMLTVLFDADAYDPRPEIEKLNG